MIKHLPYPAKMVLKPITPASKHREQVLRLERQKNSAEDKQKKKATPDPWRKSEKTEGSKKCDLKTEKILPCPFCGSNETVVFANEYDGQHYFIGCRVCEASSCRWADSIDEAVEMWNTRKSK